MTDENRYIRDRASVMAMIKFILMVLIGVALCYGATKIIAVMVPFLIGFILAKTSYSMSESFCGVFSKNRLFTKSKKRKVAMVIYIILLVLIGLFVIWAFLSLFSQVNSVVNSLSNMASPARITEMLDNLILRFSSENGGFITPSLIQSFEQSLADVWTNIVKAAPAVVSKFLASLWTMVGSIPYWIFVIICVILSGYYFIHDGPNVLKFYIRNLPNKPFRKKSISLINDLFVMIFRVLGGYLLLLIITAIEAWIGFKLAGVKYAGILAVITGIIDFLPVLGISATMIPVMIYCGLHGDFRAVLILIIAMSIMTVLRRIIEPPILGKSMHMHPLLMLVSMALGVYIWGAIGFLLGPTVMIIIIQIFKVFELDKKLLAFLSSILGKFMKKPDEDVETVKGKS
ncbi:MAG: AI-2E family transporter [Clostridiales bacterium]|nr:AI-2E family transporter [Clostridiales bacterium]